LMRQATGGGLHKATHNLSQRETSKPRLDLAIESRSITNRDYLHRGDVS